MVELRRIETGPGLVFDVSIAGDAAAPLVLLLHGCGQTPAEFADATRFPAVMATARVIGPEVRPRGGS